MPAQRFSQYFNIDEKYYAVVEYLVIRDYSVRQTAEKLGISEANVRKRYERAKKLMRQDCSEA